MIQWMPVIGTHLGAIIGGGISFLAQWMTSKRARETHMVNLAEERARWAAERQLAELKALYKDLDSFIDAAIELRMRQARKAFPGSDTKDELVADDGEIRERFEVLLYRLSNNFLIFDTDFRYYVASAP